MGKTTKCDVPILSNKRVASALSLLRDRLDYNTSMNSEELTIFMIHKKQDKHSSICTIWNEDKEAALTFNISIVREGLVIFVMPTQDKRFSHIHSCRT